MSIEKKIFVLVIFIAFFFCSRCNATENSSFDELIKDLSSPSADTRIDAAWALGELKDLRAVDYLLKALNDPDDCVRYYVIKALANLGDNKAVPNLKKALNKEIQPWMVQALKQAIEKLKTR